MAQPPLSQRLRELEAEFGCPLFTRTGRSLQLTDAGQVFYRRARDILRAVDAARDEVIRVAAQSGPTLRIGVSPTCKSYWLSRFADLRARLPERLIGVVVGDSSYLEHLLDVGQLDLALMQAPLDAPKLVVHRIASCPSVAVSPAGMLSARIGSVTLHELARHRLLLLRRSLGVGSYERLLQAFRDAGLEARVELYCSDVDVLFDLIERGLSAIAVVPESEAASLSAAYEVRPIAVDLPDYQIAAAYARHHEHAELIEQLLACWQH